ncbi:hypothetical protein IC617_03565 [Neiella sp. HB171785]|uniref:DUF3619 family protein n=1 Tax=Neiella litorisoli TaxID=2771431 RepID=A0A8J6QHG1_9GAMM|nr:hypothetical protein [Neiella litorisoli]MBD1388497.1 hypothetical protein [Neiella litorisoli]
MTSTSNNKEVEQLVNQQLDASNEQLTTSARNDISQARLAALRAGQNQRQYRSEQSNSVLAPFFNRPRWQYAMPVVALAAIMLVTYPSPETIPALPHELMSADVPNADLALLEDLEFATWLAQRQQEAGH